MAKPRNKNLLTSYGLLNDMTPSPKPGKSVGRSTFTNTLHSQVRQSFTNEVLANKKEFLAIVLRDENYYTRDTPPNNSPQAIAPNTFAGDTVKMVKVRAAIPEIHTALPLPQNSNQHEIIDLYPVFTCSRDTVSGRQPAIGEIIRVTFGDLKTLSQPTILGLVSTGNKIPGAHFEIAERCDDLTKRKMKAKAAGRAALQTPDLSKATNPTPGGAEGVGDNYDRALRIVQRLKADPAIDNFDLPVEVLLGFMAVESKGQANVLRFEPHIFLGKGAGWMKINGKRGRPELKGPMPDGVPFKRPGKKAWSLLSSETNRNAFENAMRHDSLWAVYSTSFGTYQVMGFHVIDSNKRTYTGGKTPEEFYENFNKNPELVSDEMIYFWIKKNKNWRDVITNADDPDNLSEQDLKDLIKFFNGAGQVEAYFSRIGGGLKKTYEQAKVTVAERRRQAVVNPEPVIPSSQPTSSPTTTQPPDQNQIRNQRFSENEPRRAELETVESDVPCGDDSLTQRKKDKESTVECGKSMRLGDIRTTSEETPSPDELDTATPDRITNEAIRKLHPKLRQMAVDFISDAYMQGYNLRIVRGLVSEEEQSSAHTEYKENPSGTDGSQFIYYNEIRKRRGENRPGGDIHQYGLAFEVVDLDHSFYQSGVTSSVKPFDRDRWKKIGAIGQKHFLLWRGAMEKSPNAADLIQFQYPDKPDIRGADGLLDRKRTGKVDKDGYVLI
tara:strand:- start:31643 stop:33808 length:2166 start_codon:yes stop_codon:yes gene_type:complete